MTSAPPPGSTQYADVGTRISKAISLYVAKPLPIILISAANLPFSIASFVISGPAGLLLLVPSLLVQTIVEGALILAFYQVLVGQTPSAHACFTAATEKLGALIEFFLRTVGAFLGLCITIVGIPWGIRLLVRWFFGTQAIILGNMSAKEAISESCRLVTNNWWRTLGNLLLLGLLVGFPGFSLSLALGGVVGAIAGAIIGVVLGPVLAGATTLFYLRLRYEKAQTPPATVLQ